MKGNSRSKALPPSAPISPYLECWNQMKILHIQSRYPDRLSCKKRKTLLIAGNHQHENSRDHQFRGKTKFTTCSNEDISSCARQEGYWIGPLRLGHEFLVQKMTTSVTSRTEGSSDRWVEFASDRVLMLEIPTEQEGS